MNATQTVTNFNQPANYGPKTDSASADPSAAARFEQAMQADAEPATPAATWDAVTDRRIAELHPEIQSQAAELVNQVEDRLGIQLRVTSGFRSFAEQDALFAQGRTEDGPKVTNAKAGQSYHNYGLAFDVVEIDNGKANWNTDWDAIGDIGKELGFEWGGDWKSFQDRPHFQMDFGQSTGDLLQRYNAGQRDGPYVDLP